MVQSIIAVDSPAIQRSLTILEDRCRELMEAGEQRFEAWEKETANLKQQLAKQAEVLQELKGLQNQRDSLLAERDSLLAERDSLLAEHDSLQAERDQLKAELPDAREEAELLLLQLHQVQEELEHYFLRSREGDRLAAAQAAQQQRSAALLSRMLNLSAPATP